MQWLVPTVVPHMLLLSFCYCHCLVDNHGFVCYFADIFHCFVFCLFVTSWCLSVVSVLVPLNVCSASTLSVTWLLV